MAESGAPTPADSNQISATEPKLLGGIWMKVRIAAGAALILVAGAALAPPRSPTGLETPQERPAVLLEQQVQQRDALRPFRGVQDAAARVRTHTAAIHPVAASGPPTLNDFGRTLRNPQPAGYGVFVSPMSILTHATALGGRPDAVLTLANGTTARAAVAAFEPETGLALLRTEAAGVPAVTLETVPPAAGSLAVGVGHWRGAEVATPVFLTRISRDAYRLAVEDALLPGMPVFTLGGGLLGIVGAATADGVVAYPVGDATTRLITRATVRNLRPSFGLAMQAIDDRLRTVFSEGSVVVTEVVEGSPADRAGIRIGDLLRAIGDTSVDTLDTAARALREAPVGAPTRVQVLRGARELPVEVTPEWAYEGAARARGISAPASPRAADLLSDAVFARTGLPASAVILRVNSREVSTRAQVDIELRRAKGPVPMLVHVDGQQYFVVVERQP